ncbi:hypothetical protein [Streptomyces sp. NBC_01304]|uniref:hypothetical protein n=1 Tax=Streptomyces sp. NBC_01304 TaxID=2903818 RepID=UPI002E0FD2B2|nr:hypothetical protein OG430_48950 [Streptomyces sp. NBC_01304]
MTDTSSSVPVNAVLSAGGLWRGSCESLPEVTDTNRSLSALETRMRRKIAEHSGLDADAVTVTVTPSTGDKRLDAQLAEARELRRQADELATRARASAVPLAQKLIDKGVSNRDAGTLLGVSGALVNSLIKPS